MHQPARIATMIAMAILLSGCLGSESGGEAADAGREGAQDLLELPWGLESCRASWWLAPASSEALHEHLPEGFEPAETPQLPGIDAAAGLDTYLGFDAFECRSGTGLNGTLDTVEFGSIFTRVTPPEEHAVDGIEQAYFYRWEVLVPDQPRFDRFAELGLAARTGGAQVEALSPVGSPGPWQTTLELEGTGTFTFTGSTEGPETSKDDIPYAAYTPTESDVSTWRATAMNQRSAIGHGTWVVEPGSWMADVLGAERGAGTFSVGTWSIADASILVPVR